MLNKKQSPFANFSQVQVTTKSSFPRDGRYKVEISNVKKNFSSKPGQIGQMSIILTLNILDAIVHYDQYTTPEGKVFSSNAPGERVAVHIKWSWGESAFKLYKQFLMAAAQMPPSQADTIDDSGWEEFCEKACYNLGDDVENFDATNWEPQPLRGSHIILQCETVLTQKSKKDFTKVQFEMCD